MADYITERINFEPVGIKDMAVLDSSVVSFMESFNLSTGAWEYVTSFNPYNNFKLYEIKIKSENTIDNEELIIEQIELNPLYNAILYKKVISSGNSILIKAEEDLISYKGSQLKISLSNTNTTGNIYITLYFQVI